jgi:hypothetical protein
MPERKTPIIASFGSLNHGDLFVIARRLVLLHFLIVGSVAVGMASAAEDAPKHLRIEETQLTLRLDSVQGRATVIAVNDETLTVMTAAHFFPEEDVVGKTIQMKNETTLNGRITAVARNPVFRPIRSRVNNERLAFGTQGVDTAIATVQVDLRDPKDRDGFGKIRPADLTSRFVPGSDDQILTIHIVDQAGVEHVVRAGNHTNPRCLAWGRNSYDTQRGDSGAGVFLVGKSPEGEPRLLLIGNVSQTDPRGGIASLAARGEPWITKALEGH